MNLDASYTASSESKSRAEDSSKVFENCVKDRFADPQKIPTALQFEWNILDISIFKDLFAQNTNLKGLVIALCCDPDPGVGGKKNI